jgi:hypothetical protein
MELVIALCFTIQKLKIIFGFHLVINQHCSSFLAHPSSLQRYAAIILGQSDGDGACLLLVSFLLRDIFDSTD